MQTWNIIIINYRFLIIQDRAFFLVYLFIMILRELFMFPFLICYCEGLFYGVDIAGNSIEHTRTLREREGERERERDKRRFQRKRWGDLCCAAPCSIQAKVLGPQLGNMCQPTLGGPVNNGLSQEQVVVTWNSERRLCISGCACACVCLCVCLCDRGRERPVYAPSGAPRTIPDEAEKTWMLSFYQSADRPPSLSLSLSLSVFLPPSHSRIQTLQRRTPWFLFAVPRVKAHTNSGSVKWAITRCAPPPHPAPPWKWIDPKWDQQASSSLFIDRLPHTGWNLSR